MKSQKDRLDMTHWWISTKYLQIWSDSWDYKLWGIFPHWSQNRLDIYLGNLTISFTWW